jgi:hypothetical protein
MLKERDPKDKLREPHTNPRTLIAKYRTDSETLWRGAIRKAKRPERNRLGEVRGECIECYDRALGAFDKDDIDDAEDALEQADKCEADVAPEGKRPATQALQVLLKESKKSK